MRFALSLLAFLLAGVLAALGIASQTALRPADHVTAAVSIPAGVRYVVVPSSVLKAHTGQQQLRVSGSSQAWVGIGKTADVSAWLSGQRYAQVGLDAQGQARVSVRKAPVVAGLQGGTASPAGDDLWLTERNALSSLSWNLNVPAETSLLITTDGIADAPSSLSVTWPVRAVTPLVGTELTLAAVLALIGMLAGAWGVAHAHGTARDVFSKHAPRGKKSRFGVAALVALLATTGFVSAADTGASAATATAPAALTEAQAQRTVWRAVNMVAIADANRNSALLATRMTGPALTLRKASYKILAQDDTAAALQPIPSGDLTYQLLLPQATETWPRTLLSIVSSTSTNTSPVALVLTQEDPRADYKIAYATALQPGAKLPDLPSTVVGAQQLSSRTTALSETPADLSAAYGAVLLAADSPDAKMFNLTADTLAASVGEAAKTQIVKQLGGTASLTFKDLPQVDQSQTIALAGTSGDALVVVPLSEQWTVKPKKKGVTVKPSGATELLAKTESTKTGIQSTYGYQLLFFVPGAKSNAKVSLVGYSQGLISAKELPSKKSSK